VMLGIVSLCVAAVVFAMGKEDRSPHAHDIDIMT
jgi:hypothetical protein